MESCSERRWQAVPARAAHIAVVLALCLLMITAPAAAAQAGTPTAELEGPAAVDCTVAPRPEDELRALFREVAATPLPSSLEASPAPALPPPGAPADAQTIAEITATWRQYLACLSAGDQARMFALLSDDMVRRQFVVDLAFGVTEEALFSYLAATPVPLLPDQAVPFVPFTDVRVLSDGRVAVVGPGDGGRGDVRIFVKKGDRWLLDDWFDLS
jgi:ketosteroid isomerase-like protein